MSKVPAGYKQTEVGVIPEDWEIAKLSKHVTFKTGPFGSALHKSDYVDGGVPVINPMQIVSGKIEPTWSMAITERAARNLTDFRLSFGNIVIGRRGEMGRCAFVEKKQDGWLCGTGSMIIRTAPSIDARFLQRVLSSPMVVSAIENASVGTTMVNLNQGTLGNLVVPLPPTKAEQEAIAEALSDTDALIESLEQLIAKKRHLKQGAMQKLLTGKKRLPGFSGEWEVKAIANFSAFVTKGSTPTTYGFNWVDGGVLFLRSECVSADGLDLTQSMFISEAAHSALHRGEVRGGDILMTITGNVGRVVHLPSNFGIANINQHIARMRINNPNVSSGFVFHWFSQANVRANYALITTGQAYPQISLKQVRETLIPLPSIEEQTAIATILSDMDAEIVALESKLAKTLQLKQGMMHNLLTGRIRLL